MTEEISRESRGNPTAFCFLGPASSVALNLAEGSERGSDVDQRRFYRMAMGSIRECQAILDLIEPKPLNAEAQKLGDQLAACVFALCKSIDKKIDPNCNRELGTVNREPKN